MASARLSSSTRNNSTSIIRFLLIRYRVFHFDLIFFHFSSKVKESVPPSFFFNRAIGKKLKFLYNNSIIILILRHTLSFFLLLQHADFFPEFLLPSSIEGKTQNTIEKNVQKSVGISLLKVLLTSLLLFSRHA